MAVLVLEEVSNDTSIAIRACIRVLGPFAQDVAQCRDGGVFSGKRGARDTGCGVDEVVGEGEAVAGGDGFDLVHDVSVPCKEGCRECRAGGKVKDLVRRPVSDMDLAAGE